MSGSDACPPDYENCHDIELPEHPATISGFFLDAYEVTVGRFRVFVDGFNGTLPRPSAGQHPRIPGSGWRSDWDKFIPQNRAELLEELSSGCDGGGDVQTVTWTEQPGAYERHPMDCVNWYLAFAFCLWDGGRLPTETEWEYAAAGGEQDRLYPWGSEPPEVTRTTYGSEYDGLSARSMADLPPVGTFPSGRGRWGHDDLAGSMNEWILDQLDWYSTDPCLDCANLNWNDQRTYRGGAFNYYRFNLRAAKRWNTADTDDQFTRKSTSGHQRRFYIGLRCARDG